MIDMNWLMIVVVSVITFALAPLWFGPIFGNLWMKIHGWENLSKAELKKQEEWIFKLLALEALSTLVMITVLTFFIVSIPDYSALSLALLIWIGFMVPNIISGVIWGADKKEWQAAKIMILSGFNLVALIIASYIISIWI